MAGRSKRDRAFMREALALAERAGELGDVPVGAVVVRRGEVIARGFNRREAWQDPTGHAELLAIRRAAEALGSWRLDGCTLFVTLEPCPMCAGLIVASRLERVVYGARDEKAGAVRSLYAMLEDPRLNHRVKVETLMADECSEALTSFFAALRERGQAAPEACCGEAHGEDAPDADA